MNVGRRVHVILVAVCCDHPALCRVSGFADHSHATAFCTKCKIERDQLKTQTGITDGQLYYTIAINLLFIFGSVK